SKLSVTGQAGGSYTLTSANVEVTSSTSFSVTLNDEDKLTVNGLFNKNGTTAADATTYNLAAAADWVAALQSDNFSDAVGNAVTVSNVAAPVLTSASYSADTGSLVVTGTGFIRLLGTTNDVVSSLFSFTGQGAESYTLTDSADVEITSGTSFTITLSTTDKAQVNALATQDGSTAADGTSYQLATADDWMPATADATDITSTIAITVSAVTTSPTPTPTAVEPTPTPTPNPVPTGSLTGRVVVNGIPQAGVLVYVPNLGSAITDDNGEFSIIGSQIGVSYTAFVQRTGVAFEAIEYSLNDGSYSQIAGSTIDYNPKNCSENDISNLLANAAEGVEQLFTFANQSAARLRGPNNSKNEVILTRFNTYLDRSREVPEITLSCDNGQDVGCERVSLTGQTKLLKKGVRTLRKQAQDLNDKLVKLKGRAPKRSVVFQAKIRKFTRKTLSNLGKLPKNRDNCIEE
ncbi:MAG: hypothetical protein KDD62_14155, partial [Bdellovibrionales bacterium]|nr:hypothetical protein [Bdellovibrionales bacterium]